MKYLTIKQAAGKPGCPYTVATLRDYISKGRLRRIVVPGGEGEFVQVGKLIRIVEENFDLWLYRRTYLGAEAALRGVPMAKRQRQVQ